MSELWYYEKDSQEFGPVHAAELQKLVRVGTLGDTVRVRHAESSQWTRYSRVQDTVSRAAASLQTANDFSDLPIEFNEGPAASIPTTEAPGEAPKSPPDGVNLVTSGLDDELNNDLDIDAFRIDDGTDADINEIRIDDGSDAAGAGDFELDDRLYHCDMLGETFGPMPMEELLELARSATISAETPVRQDAHTDWFPAGDLSDLKPVFAARQVYFDLPEVSLPGSSEAKTESDAPASQGNGAAAGEASAPRSGGADSGQHKPAPRGGQPRRRKRSSVQEELRRLRAENERLRKGGSDDSKLTEIFSEVFGGESEAKTTPASPKARPTNRPADSAGEHDHAAVSHPAVSNGMVMPSSLQTETNAPNPHVPNPMAGSRAAAASRPPLTPPAPAPSFPKPRRSASMPDLKVPAMVGGGIAVVALLVWGVMSMDLSGLTGMDVEKVLTEYQQKYDALGDGPVSDSEWTSFRDNVRSDIGAAIRYLKSDGAPVGREVELLTAATRLVQLANSKPDDTEQREQFYAEFQAAFRGSDGG